MSEALTEKYRPRTFDEVTGHEAVVASLENALKKDMWRAFLFSGPSGTGKTTLARISATAVGCNDVLEIDAATNTGIEAMREVTADLVYRPLGGDRSKAIIVDEFHALSKQATQSLLKILENPPDWVYWFLCTTEPQRILPTIFTRSFHCALKPIPTREIMTLLSFVTKEEKFKLDAGVISLCASEAKGSPRQALANLAVCVTTKSVDAARDLLHTAEGSSEAIDLARALARGATWSEVQPLLSKMKDVSPESVRHVVRAYMTTLILNAKTEKAAGRGLEILDAFSQPFNSFDGLSPLVMACGKVVFS